MIFKEWFFINYINMYIIFNNCIKQLNVELLTCLRYMYSCFFISYSYIRVRTSIAPQLYVIYSFTSFIKLCWTERYFVSNVITGKGTGKNVKKKNVRIERFPEVCCSYDRLSVFWLGKGFPVRHCMDVNGHSISLWSKRFLKFPQLRHTASIALIFKHNVSKP